MRLTQCLMLVFALSGLLLGGCAQQSHLELVLDDSSLLLPPEPLAVDKAALKTQLDEILYRLSDRGATVSARVVDPATGEVLYDTGNVDEPFIPASNMKLLVTATALHHFDPSEQFDTYLAWDGENLWIVGTGDPATGDPTIAEYYGEQPTTFFDEWAEAMKAAGITEVTGKLYYYDGALDDEWVHPSWGISNQQYWWGCPIAGLNYNNNCVDITVFPTEPGEPAGYEVVSPASVISIGIAAVTAAEGEEHRVDLRKTPGENAYVIRGTVGRRAGPFSKPVMDPGAYFAASFKRHLETHHDIKFSGPTVRATNELGFLPVPPQEMILATESTKFLDMLRRINKDSQNTLTEGLSKLTGQRMAEQATGSEQLIVGTWDLGAQAIREMLESAGVDTTQLNIADGSGLSRDNKVTTRLVSDLLIYMLDHEHYDVYRNSMTIGGVDGTTRRRMKKIPGKVRSKTGTLSGVVALSGYIENEADPNRPIVFSTYFNNAKGSSWDYRGLQDEFCEAIYSVLGGSGDSAGDK